MTLTTGFIILILLIAAGWFGMYYVITALPSKLAAKSTQKKEQKSLFTKFFYL